MQLPFRIKKNKSVVNAAVEWYNRKILFINGYPVNRVKRGPTGRKISILKEGDVI